MNDRRLSKLFLRVFIVSICASAIAGIIALAIPSDNEEFVIKVFLTTATIAGASVCGLASGGCLSRGHRVLPTAGLILTGLSASLVLIGMWPEIGSEAYWKTTVIVGFYAIACAHLSMLFMANLAGGYRWAFLVACQLILGLATLLAAGIVFDLFENGPFWRATGIVSILVAAVTLLIPVFHRLSREHVATLEEAADPLCVVEEEIARLKKRLLDLESKRRVLLGRTPVEPLQTSEPSQE